MRATLLTLLLLTALAQAQDELDADFLAQLATLERYALPAGSEEAEALEDLMDCLGDPDFATRETAEQELAARGIQAVPALVARLNDGPMPEEAFRIDSLLRNLVQEMWLDSRTYRDGTPKSETLRFGSDKWGECRWYKNGQLREVKRFRAGEPAGVWQTWHDNGQLKERYTFAAGQRQGVSQSWWEDGSLARECYYLDDQLDGSWKSWQRGGQLYLEGTYQKGLKHGEWISWADPEHPRGETWVEGAPQP